MKQVVVKVPGKVMLAGEYDVLEGGCALASSIDRYLTATLTQSDSIEGCEVHSNLWPQAQTIPAAGESHYTDPLLEAASFGMQKYQSNGLKIVIDSDLDVEFGVGSSSALRLAVLTGMAVLADSENLYSWERAEFALELQKKAQSAASGYDIATQLCGGVIAFTPNADFAGSVRAIENTDFDAINEFFHIFIGGAGAPTGSVMATTRDWLNKNDRHAALKIVSKTLNDSMLDWFATHNNDLQLIAAIKNHRQFFEASPHFPKRILESLSLLEGFDKSFTFKTTGAGGEDALLIIGHENDMIEATTSLQNIGWKKLNSQFCVTGLEVCLDGEELDDT